MTNLLSNTSDPNVFVYRSPITHNKIHLYRNNPARNYLASLRALETMLRDEPNGGPLTTAFKPIHDRLRDEFLAQLTNYQYKLWTGLDRI